MRITIPSALGIEERGATHKRKWIEKTLNDISKKKNTMFEGIERLRYDHRAQYTIYKASQLFHQHGFMGVGCNV